MYCQIQHILVPVCGTPSELPFLKRAAEIAAAHRAVLQIDYIDQHISWLKRLITGDKPQELQLSALLLNAGSRLMKWKSKLETQYGVKVIVSAQLGSWSSCIRHRAKAVKTDLVILALNSRLEKRGLISKSQLEKTIEASPCPVLTLISGDLPAQEWKNVVMPVSNRVPEPRIAALFPLIGSSPVTVHLVAKVPRSDSAKEEDILLLTEIIKRLKPAGSVKIKCRYLSGYGFSARKFISDAKSNHADALITNQSFVKPVSVEPADSYIAMPYA